MKRINLSISNIAPLIGLDAYNNFPRIICEIWKRNYPEDYKIVEDKLKLEGTTTIATSNEMNDIWEIDEAFGTNILQQVKDVNANETKTSSSMVNQQDIIAKYINENAKLSQLDTKQKEEIAKKVCSITNKKHGVINEDTILSEFCRLSEKTIKDTQQWVNISLTETKPTKPTSPIQWVIVGKYDGITSDGELVEAKMRQKALFKKIRDYENIQIQLYMHALQFEKAYLVESYTNKKNINQIYVNEANYDEYYVKDVILARIYKFIEFFDLFMDNENKNIRESLLRGDKDRKIYKKYESEFLDIEIDIENDGNTQNYNYNM